MRVIRLAQVPPPAVAMEATIREAIPTISSRHGCAVGVVADGRLVGTLSKEDILRRVVEPGRDPGATTVGEVMTTPPMSVPTDHDSRAALALMLDRHQCYLPVVGVAGELRGWLSMCELLQDSVEELERHLQSMAAYTGADGAGG